MFDVLLKICPGEYQAVTLYKTNVKEDHMWQL